jgi:LPS-assembly lipoprotein
MRIGYALILCVSIMLCSCGIHLRQAAAWPVELSTLHFDSSEPNTPLAIQLREMFKSFKVQLVDATLFPHAIIFKLEPLKFSEVYPAVNTASLATNYMVLLTVTASLSDANGTLLLPSHSFTISRSIILSSNQVLIPNIGAVPKRELQREAATLIYYWLTSIEVKNSLRSIHAITNSSI